MGVAPDLDASFLRSLAAVELRGGARNVKVGRRRACAACCERQGGLNFALLVAQAQSTKAPLVGDTITWREDLRL